MMDPLAPTSGASSRLALVAAVAALVWLLAWWAS
jgi:hypothetical protein